MLIQQMVIPPQAVACVSSRQILETYGSALVGAEAANQLLG
jgi:hypothetical protein